MAISDVQTKGSWYYIIDSNGKKSATLTTSTGDLLGVRVVRFDEIDSNLQTKLLESKGFLKINN